MRFSSGLEQANSPARLQIVVHHAALRCDRQRRLAGIAGHLDEAEAVIGEPRLVDLRPLALERVDVGHLRAADVVQVERAVGLERLGVAQPRPPCRAGRTP